MNHHHRRLTTAAVLACVLGPAAGAQAATKEVTLGLKKAPSGTPETANLHAWFPKKVKVNVGDTVVFRPYAFGYPVVGRGAIPEFFAADPSRPVSGAKGPDDQLLWFNGQPSFRVDPFHLQPTGDGKATGRGLDSPGLSTDDGPPKPYEVEFTKTGAHLVRDGVHPDVAMKVVVVPKGKKVPSGSSDKAAAVRQAAKLAKRAKRLADDEPRSGTIQAGNDTRNIGFYEFFGKKAKVAAGAPVTFKTGKRSLDVHNLMIGPMEWLKDVPPFEVNPPDVFLGAIATYASQPPTQAPSFDGSQNGGYFNTGAIDADRGTPLPREVTFSITKPGAYTYYCLFHGPDMNGTLTVE